MVNMLLARGASINARDNKGDTPLTLAQDREHIEVISILEAVSATSAASRNIGSVPYLINYMGYSMANTMQKVCHLTFKFLGQDRQKISNTFGNQSVYLFPTELWGHGMIDNNLTAAHYLLLSFNERYRKQGYYEVKIIQSLYTTHQWLP